MMNFIDAYLIVESYSDALAKKVRPNEPCKRVSTLPASKEQILAAYKLYSTHVLFWGSISLTDFDGFINLLNYIGSFCDDVSISRYVEIDRLLNAKSLFRRIRRPEIRVALEHEKQHIMSAIAATHIESLHYTSALEEFIDTIQPLISKTKKQLASIGESLSFPDVGNILGNFVCDIYEIADIDRDINDTEYFWPFRYLYELSMDRRYDYLFARYKQCIANAYFNSISRK